MGSPLLSGGCGPPSSASSAASTATPPSSPALSDDPAATGVSSSDEEDAVQVLPCDQVLAIKFYRALVGINIRREPDIGSDRIGSVGVGDVFEVTGEVNGFLKLKNGRGWVGTRDTRGWGAFLGKPIVEEAEDTIEFTIMRRHGGAAGCIIIGRSFFVRGEKVQPGGPAHRVGRREGGHAGWILLHWILTHVDGLEVSGENFGVAMDATREPGRTFTIRVKRPEKEQRKVTPAEEEAELRKKAFFAVVVDDTNLLAEVLQRLPWDVWSRWRVRSVDDRGIDLLDFSQVRGSQGACSLLAEAWLWREVAWASVRDWACVRALVAEKRAFPRHCASWDEDTIEFTITRGRSGAAGYTFLRASFVRIGMVEPGGPAYRAGMREDHAGWIITHVDGLEVTAENCKVALDATCGPDRTFTIRVKRPDKEAAFCRLSHRFVLLRADLFALVLQYAHEGARYITRPRRLA